MLYWLYDLGNAGIGCEIAMDSRLVTWDTGQWYIVISHPSYETIARLANITQWHPGLFQIIICLFTDSAMAEGAVTIGDPIEKPQLKHAQRLCIHNNTRSTRSPQNGSNSSTWQDMTAKLHPDSHATKETRLTRKQDGRK
jgi:hypothetical protein